VQELLVEAYCIGELLVDIIPVKPGSLHEGATYEIHFGGAPANTCIGISRLGHKAGMIGAVGDDPFGDFLINTLKENGVNTKFVVKKRARTSLAFVILYENGERDFFFYRLPWTTTADSMLSIEDIDLDEVAKAKVLHVSGFATSYPPSSETIMKAMREMYKRGLVVSYDPTYRRDIWLSEDKAFEVYLESLKYTTFLTMSIDELYTFHKTTNYRDLAKKLLEEYQNLEIVAIRLGARGAYVRTREEEEEIPGFKIKVVDTTGAGDAWTAGFIAFYILERMDLATAVKYANAVAALKCMRRGAISSLPYRAEAVEFAEKHSISNV